MKIIGFEVESIHCDKCVSKIVERLSSIDGIHKVDVIQYRRVLVLAEDSVEKELIIASLNELGYKVKE